MNVGKQRDWSKYAKALDMKLGGATLDEIAIEFDITRERARQIVQAAAQRLSHRIFKGVPRFVWRWNAAQNRWDHEGRR
jgi:hypothetical protein